MSARVVVVRRSRRRAFAPVRAVLDWIRAFWRALRGIPRAPNQGIDASALSVEVPALAPRLRRPAGGAGLCTACGRCVAQCPSRCLFLVDSVPPLGAVAGGRAGEADEQAAFTRLELEPLRCIGCGRCVERCPEAALELRPLARADWAPLSARPERLTLGRVRVESE